MAFGDQDGFVGYVPKTKDAGTALLWGTIAFCVLSQLLLPFFVALGRRWDSRRQNGKALHESLIESAGVNGSTEVATCSSASKNSPDEKNKRSPGSSPDGKGTSGNGGKAKLPLVARDKPMTNESLQSKVPEFSSTFKAQDEDDDDENRYSNYIDATTKWLEDGLKSKKIRKTRSRSGSFDGSACSLDGSLCSRNSGHSRKSKRSTTSSTSKRSRSSSHASFDEVSASDLSSLPSTATAFNRKHGIRPGKGGRIPEKLDFRPRRSGSPTPSVASSSAVSFASVLDAGVHGGRRRNYLYGGRAKRMRQMRVSENQDEMSVTAFPLSIQSWEKLPDDTIDEVDQVCCAISPLCCKVEKRLELWNDILDLFEWDRETQRIINLATPLTITLLVETLLEIVHLIMIASVLGTEATAAVAVVDVILSFSSEFLMGITDSITTLCPQALGSGNDHLAGQYTQIVMVFYTVCSVPFIILWSFFVYDIMIWWDFSEEISTLAQTYARVAVYAELTDGLTDAFAGFLEVADYEEHAMVAMVLSDVASICTTAVALFFLNASLVDLAYIDVLISFTGLIATMIYAVQRRWIDEYKAGIFGWGALQNTAAITSVMKTAGPLALGSLLASGEWEVLTVFASHMGPAEVAAWALLGSVYDVFESTVESVGDAAEIRCAFHMGRRNPKMARKSSYKAIVIGVVLSIILTSVFFIVGEDLVTWVTKDPTLQHMLVDLIPLVGIGNVTMCFGMMSWALVGAQGRYHFATLIAFLNSWLLTVPLSALFVYYFGLDLQSLVAAMVVGYGATGTMLSYVLIRSDWEKLANKVYELQQLNNDCDSSSDEDSDDSSSSSSSSSSSGSSDSDDSDDTLGSNFTMSPEFIV